MNRTMLAITCSVLLASAASVILSSDASSGVYGKFLSPDEMRGLIGSMAECYKDEAESGLRCNECKDTDLSGYEKEKAPNSATGAARACKKGTAEQECELKKTYNCGNVDVHYFEDEQCEGDPAATKAMLSYYIKTGAGDACD